MGTTPLKFLKTQQKNRQKWKKKRVSEEGRGEGEEIIKNPKSEK